MKHTIKILFFSALSLSSCISQFIPQTKEDKEFLVIEGLITDKTDANTIKLSISTLLGTTNRAVPVTGCTVSVADNLGSNVSFTEVSPGSYKPSSSFQGVIGRSYVLHITRYSESNALNYESVPMELKPVPLIDSVFYEKVTIDPGSNVSLAKDGCQIYLNTHDASNKCKFYRWEYDETWKFEIPYSVPNKICWVTDKSKTINIKSTTSLTEDKILRYPINYISNQTDRLSRTYSILVTQYSLNEDEYLYWEKLENIAEQVGGLYDMIPASVPSNIYCTSDPAEKVLGFFSVSATSSKRIFLKGNFRGQFNPYTADQCVADTIFAGDPLPANLGTSVWIIVSNFMPPYVVTTYSKGCYDCTVRGTNIPHDYWIENK